MLQRATSIYLVCYHSEPGHMQGSEGQCAAVEAAIEKREWPYDNGDDPSFYVARKCGGRLTWGVCRQDLRNAIRTGSIVVFLSFDPSVRPIPYRLSAVATVEQKLNRRAAYLHPQLRGKPYINTLIRPVNGGWRHEETDRPDWARHHDWLWRLADHRGITQRQFDQVYGSIYNRGFLSNAQLRNGLRFASNYILFSDAATETYICPRPPFVAMAGTGKHEKWSNLVLEALTVGTAARYLTSGRDYLRTSNSGRPHRQIHFEMPAEKAKEWRRQLIAALKQESRLARDVPSFKPDSRASAHASC